MLHRGIATRHESELDKALHHLRDPSEKPPSRHVFMRIFGCFQDALEEFAGFFIELSERVEVLESQRDVNDDYETRYYRAQARQNMSARGGYGSPDSF